MTVSRRALPISRASLHGAAPAANRIGERSIPGNGVRSVTRSAPNDPLIVQVVRKARALWPAKASHEIHFRTGASHRWAKKLLSARVNISGEHLVALLRSEEGLEFLEAILGDDPPSWWGRFKKVHSIANLRRAIERLEKEAAD